jgi:hypothetical protein
MSLESKASLKADKSKTLHYSFHANKTNPAALIHSPADQLSFLQRTIGNHEVERLLKSGVIQAKLTSGKFGDAHEQEADRIAEQVASGARNDLPNACHCGGVHRAGGCQCQAERLQAEGIEGSTHLAHPAVPAIVHEVLRSSGRPLHQDTRSFMEERFRHDFSRVRIHTGEQAAESARAVNASAYTVGQHVVFAEDHYEPHSRRGSKLLAHELVHVIQQERGGASSSALLAGTLERSADAAAITFLTGRGLIHVEGASAPGLARQPLFPGTDPNAVREPRSLRESLDLNQVTDWQLKQEIELIKQWLQANPFKSESDELRNELERLQIEEQRRTQEAKIKTAERVPKAKVEPAPGVPTKKKTSPATEWVRMTQEELDGSSRGKVLLKQILQVNKLDLLKQWALELKDIPHHKSGNYLLLFFEQLRDLSPAAADGFIKILGTKGVMVDEIAMAWELHKLLVEEQTEPLKVHLQKYPAYSWKVALGQVAQPIVDVVNLIIHFVPVVGQALGGVEALLGREILTGRKLEGWERLLGILPYAGNILKAGRVGARAILIIARQTGLSANAALRLVTTAGALSSEADRLREIKKIVDTGGQLSAEHQRILKATYGALKPLEKELGMVGTAAEREAASAAKVTQGQKAAEVSKTAPGPATAETAAGKVHGATATAGKGAQGIEEEVIKTGKLAEYSFAHRGHTLRILKDGRIVRCSKLCKITSLEEEFADLIGRYSQFKPEITRLRKLERAMGAPWVAQETEKLAVRMKHIQEAEGMSLAELKKQLKKPEFDIRTGTGKDLHFIYYQRKGGKLTFEQWESGEFGKARVSVTSHPTSEELGIQVVRHGRKESFSQTNRTLAEQLKRGFLTEEAGTDTLSLEELRGKRVLDLAAGTQGKTVQDLRELNIDAHGMDIALSKDVKQPYLRRADVAAKVPFQGQFDVAFEFYGGLCYGLGKQTGQAFRNVVSRLRPGGILYLAPLTKNAQTELLPFVEEIVKQGGKWTRSSFFTDEAWRVVMPLAPR